MPEQGETWGRHGVITGRHGIVMRPIFGGGGESKPFYSYDVRTDQGFMDHSAKLEPETQRPERAVPDPIWHGEPVTPQSLKRGIASDLKSANMQRAAAARARKPENKRALERAAQEKDKDAVAKREVLDAWREKSPEEAASVLGEKLGERPVEGGWTEVGKNHLGQTLYQDARGVRSIIENGVRRTEPVSMVPTREGVQIATDRGNHPEFRTADETAEAHGAGTAQEPSEEPQPQEAPIGPVRLNLQVELAHSIARRLAGEQGNAPGVLAMSSVQLNHLAESVYGSRLAEGKFDRSDVYDALETGVNLYVRAHPQQFDPRLPIQGARQAADELEALKNKLPTQTVRAGEKETHQQFSTPPDYSYAAAWVANLSHQDLVLEPSAGTGSLVAPAMNSGAKVVTNEISAKRKALVESLVPARSFGENAEQLDRILPQEIWPTVVVMNPPFSETAGRLAGIKDNMVGANHISQALRRLKPGGRLVAIVGGGSDSTTRGSSGMSFDSPTYRKWWDGVRAQVRVLANVRVSGDIYGKYGTNYATRLLVIDKVAPDGTEPVVGEVKTARELIDHLEGVRYARPPIATEPAGQPMAGQPAGAGMAPERPPGGQPREPVRPTAGPAGTGGTGAVAGAGERLPVGPGNSGGTAAEPSPRPGEGQPVVPEQPGRPGPSGTDGNAVVPAPSSEDVAGGRTGGNGDVLRPPSGGERPLPASAPDAELGDRVKIDEAAADPTNGGEITEAVYEPYKPQRVQIEGAQAHPGELVQSAAMASVMPPRATYAPRLPKDVIAKGMLSQAQLEPVIYAGQAHSQMLPSAEGEKGQRRGFFIGDGTGVGKGREVAGVILDNFQQGRTKALWVSENRPLVNDAKRDWKGLGQDENDIFDVSKAKPASSITAKRGIGFLSYDTLKSSAKGGVDEAGNPVKGRSRLDQMAEWLGSDFDGVIAFDEAHNMANAIQTKGTRGVKDASAKALAGIELQRRLPNARVVYVSATGATEVSNLAYAERLGLWGRGTAFPSKQDFISKVSSGGIAAMELVARDMKALGHYTARNLSYRGVDYDRIEHSLSPEQRDIYDKLTEGWQVTLNNINEALEITEATKNADAKSRAMSAYWGTHQRFFNQVITSMQMPSVVNAVEADIKAGRQAVLQLVNTNEAAQERAIGKLDEEEELEDLDMTPRDQLMQMIEHSFPIYQYEEYVDENGTKRSRQVFDSEGKPVINQDAVAMRDQLLDQIGSIRVPDGPLEILLNHFGTDKVAEVTGRKRRVVRKPDENGQTKAQIESRPGSANVTEADAFQSAKKPILVFSQAGGTGRSYHAEIGTKSADMRRSHYLVQAGWRADKAIQGFGRTHRTNEASQPIFHLVTTDLKGQKRFISSIARRLSQLGALTKGERRAGDQGLFSARDNLESQEARDALYRFYLDLHHGDVPGLRIEDFEKQTGLKLVDQKTGGLVKELPGITQFLNRLLSLKIDMQNGVFDEFASRLDDVIDRAAAAGTLDTGVETVKADRITKEEDRPVYTDPESGAETRYARLAVSNRNHPATFEQIVDGDKLTGYKTPAFYVRNRQSGKVYAVAETRPVTDAQTGAITEQYRIADPLTYRFVPQRSLDSPDAQKRWARIATPAEAKAAWDDQVAKTPEFRTEDMHLITGAVLPIWDRLPGSPKVYRLQTQAGERMLGRQIDGDMVADTLKALGAEASGPQLAPEQVAERILDGARAELANGWSIKRSLVAGEPRLELVGPDYRHDNELRNDGVFKERIANQTRYFIPTGDDAAKVLASVTARRPVTSMTASRPQGRGVMEMRRLVDPETLVKQKPDGRWYADVPGARGSTYKDRQDAVFRARLEVSFPREPTRTGGDAALRAAIQSGDVKRGARALIDRLRLEENLGLARNKRLASIGGDRATLFPGEAREVEDFIDFVGHRMFDDVGMRIMRGPHPHVMGQYEVASHVVRIFRAAIDGGILPRTAVHELWHSLEQALPREDREAVIAEFQRQRESWLRTHEWARPFVDEDGEMEPMLTGAALKQWEIDWGDRKTPVKIEEEKHLDDGRVLPRRAILPMTSETYRYTNASEYFAETMADKHFSSMDLRDAKVRSIWGHIKAFWGRMAAGFKRLFGRDATGRIFEGFGKGEYEPPNRRRPTLAEAAMLNMESEPRDIPGTFEHHAAMAESAARAVDQYRAAVEKAKTEPADSYLNTTGLGVARQNMVAAERFYSQHYPNGAPTEQPLLPTRAVTPDELAARARAQQKTEAEASMAGRKVGKRPGQAGKAQESAEELPLFGGKRQGSLFSIMGEGDETPTVEETTGPLGRGVATARQMVMQAADKAQEVLTGFQMAATPMALGTEESRAVAKTFANSQRRNDWEFYKTDRFLEKNFTPARRREMFEALDEESVRAQLRAAEKIPEGEPGAIDADGRRILADFDRRERDLGRPVGLDRLDSTERAAVTQLNATSKANIRVAKRLGMYDGEGIPWYAPRYLVEVVGGEMQGVRSESKAPRQLDQIGKNLKTTSSRLLHRKHLTAEETEEAAQKALQKNVAVVRDIRAVAHANRDLQRAIAGRALIERIRKIGHQTGQLTVSDGALPNDPTQNWFTIPHPAFFRRQAVLEKDPDKPGSFRPVRDSDGNVLMSKVPIYVRGDFEGPLRAVLSTEGGAIYRGFMALKGKTMSVIMYSPVIHNQVEWGRALPAMPGKVATFRIYFEGNAAKRGLPYAGVWQHIKQYTPGLSERFGTAGPPEPGRAPAMVEAINAGMVPIGHWYGFQDISSVLEQPNIAAGRSWTAQLLGAIPGLFDERAGEATMRAIDRVGNVWHNALLWDRIGDLQMGLYVNLRDKMVRSLAAKEITGPKAEKSAQVIAAHMANRYAGALPLEAMSGAARRWANSLLFSRSFTLGNLGVMKDAISGLPRDAQAQILKEAGPILQKFARNAAMRKAIAIMLLDIGLLYATGAILQSAIAVMSGDSTLDKEAQGYIRRWNRLMLRVKETPSDLLNPFWDVKSLLPQGENEPGKEDYVMVGYGPDGAVYMNPAVGKMGREFEGWATGPLDMLRRKAGTIAKPGMEVLSNDDGFGNKVYNPWSDAPVEWLKNIGRIAALFFEDQLPGSTIRAAMDAYAGRGDRATEIAQVLGPLALGATFSKGAPGGPAMAEVYRAKDRFWFNFHQDMPSIRRDIQDHAQDRDFSGAIKSMTAIGVPPGMQKYEIQTTLNPAAKFTRRQMKDFESYASPEMKQDMEHFLEEDRERAAPQ